MRHLIDTYIEADEPRVISPFDNLSLLDLIVKTGIGGAIAARLSNLKGNDAAIAEILENNVRSEIVKGRLNDPAFYDTMSAQLQELRHRHMVLRVRPGADTETRHAVVSRWYRGQLRTAASRAVTRWEPRIGVQAGQMFVRRMKTRWGSCNTRTGSVRLNTDLAKKPPECLEYVVVHERVHLLEPSHDAHFIALMDRFMPGWRVYRDALNRRPILPFDSPSAADSRFARRPPVEEDIV